MIVVISHPDDQHATHVLDALTRRGRDAFLFDVADFPNRATLSVDYAIPVSPQVTVCKGDQTVALSEASAVWWRRPLAPDLAAVSDPDVRGFTHGEWHEALNGLYQLLPCPWMNPPVRDQVASRKALQLAVAAELGLRVPRTLMTSDPDRARAFIDELGVGRTIYKTFSATHQVWRETRIVREEDLAALDTLRVAPTIFQEYIPPIEDIRVTIVGGQIFPMAITVKGTDFEADFRLSMGQAKTRATELPPAIRQALMQLMRRFGLVYGAVDLRLSTDGDYVFFEVNTAGEFLFVERQCGLPVTEALTDWLTSPY